MKINILLIYALFLIVLSISLNSVVFAQKTILPSGLTDKSSLEDILNWTDKTSLAQARIGLNADAPAVEAGEVITSSTTYSERAIFSQGFKLAKIDGCKITLRNDAVELISFSTKYPNPADGSLDDFRKIQNNQTKYAGELSIPLQKLKPEKAAYRHPKKADKADLPETWRVEFKRRFEFFLIPKKEKLKSLMDNLMKIEIIGAGQDGRNDSMNGDVLTFTFDDKQMSENFYAAFSQAITLCKDK